ncbi:MAG: polynucleotide adenylyltransferase [Planctomycetes bacterium]|nr:polynucleotide adenylyltransferase [Planctomycetota bacterium]
MLLAMPQCDPETTVRELARAIAARGGRAWLVGGGVRDALLGRARKDFDLEVYGLTPAVLEETLRREHAIHDVGRSFGVLKLANLPIDVALPRRETKVARGHKGFAIDADPFLDLATAALRRDLTVNAIYEDPLTGEINDPLDGRRDLAARLLRHASPRFVEDPLRVLRVAQLAARFRFDVAPETVALSRTIDLAELPRERLEDEWKKLLLLGEQPSLGLAFLRECGALRTFPELVPLVGCPQHPLWHPEGDVWVHTLHALDHFAGARAGDGGAAFNANDWIVGLAVLCHDLGKPGTTVNDNGVWRSPGHSEAGEAPTRAFLARITAQTDVVESVVALVLHHLKPQELWKAQPGDGAIRRLATKVNLRLLIRVARHDDAGRPPRPIDDFPAGRWLVERAEALAAADTAPTPIVLGRHLIELGQKPGRTFKPLLDRCFEAQLDGAFSDLAGGIAHLNALLASGSVRTDADRTGVIEPGSAPHSSS